jgi:hypothetical protein
MTKETQPETETPEVKAPEPSKAATPYFLVQMDDGRKVEFSGKRRMLKETILDDAGYPSIRMDFVNGETRTFKIPEKLLTRFAGHGAEQKFGDEIAGLADVEDAVMAVDALMERMNAGEWAKARESNGMAGAGLLARALHQHSGKPIEQIKAFLARKTHADRTALSQNAAIAPIIAELKAKKGKAKPAVDTDALLEELM